MEGGQNIAKLGGPEIGKTFYPVYFYHVLHESGDALVLVAKL